MKRTIIIILIISIALLITGILYGEHPRTDHGKTLTMEETYNAQTPAQTPDMVIEPMSNFPAY